MKEHTFEDHEPLPVRFEEIHKLYAIDPKRALVELKGLAESGSIKSMICLGSIFRDGIAVEMDISKAKYWFGRAVSAGSVRASYYLGDLYWRQKEYEKVEITLSIGVEKNYPPAIYLLGKFYAFGPKERRNIEKGLILFETGSKLDHIFARRGAATLLMRGSRGFLGRIKGILLFFGGIVELVRVSYHDSSSPRLKKNGVW